MSKTALITGITGQDGSYLAELLLSKGYDVHGLVRRSSSINTGRIDGIYQDPHESHRRLFLHYGDLTDGVNLVNLLHKVQPDEVYNLGAMSHVKVSFEMPEYTASTDAVGTVRLLEAIRASGTRLPLLPGINIRDVRRLSAAAKREHRLLPALPVWRRQALLALGHRQLPRGLRPVRRQRHPVQPRVAPPRRDLRHPQDHPRRRPHQGRPSGRGLPRQPRRRPRLGLRPRVRRGHVAHAAAG